MKRGRDVIKELKSPKDKMGLQKLLAVINYFNYRYFIPNLSELISPYRQILKNDAEFAWNEK